MMKFTLGAAAAALALAVASTASAATIVIENANLDYSVRSDGNPDGDTLILDTLPAGLFVRAQATGPAAEYIGESGGPANGAASLIGDYTEITFSPYSGFTGFSEFAFNFEWDNGELKSPYDAQIDLTFATGPAQTFYLGDIYNAINNPDIPLENPGKIHIIADLGQSITSVRIYDLGGWTKVKSDNVYTNPYKIDAIKQISFDAFRSTSNPVPEPATWAMMIGGFAAVGSMVRRRKAGAVVA